VAAEVSEARAEILRATQRNQDRIDALRDFLSRSPEQLLQLEDDFMTSVSRNFGPPSPFDSSGFALSGILAGGNLEIIADDELGAALIAWSQFPAEIERDYAETLQVHMMRSEKVAMHGVFSAVRNMYRDPPIPEAAEVREVFFCHSTRSRSRRSDVSIDLSLRGLQRAAR
jgi:hypothetical protein